MSSPQKPAYGRPTLIAYSFVLLANVCLLTNFLLKTFEIIHILSPLKATKQHTSQGPRRISLVGMVSEHEYKLCQEASTVSSEFAKNPDEAPSNIAKRLYGHYKPSTDTPDTSNVDRPYASSIDLERARQCGNWGPQQPSEFFLRVYHDVLSCLGADPLGGMVSPPLMGSHGTMPLSIIAPLADIFRHMANLIVRAEKEIVMVTCSWSPSVAVGLISDALKELSTRAGRRGERVLVKVMFDKAGPSHFMNCRQFLGPDAYSGYVSA